MDTLQKQKLTNLKPLLLGVFAGVLITLTIFLLFKTISSDDDKESSTPKPKVLKLSLSDPQDNIATSENTIEIKGETVTSSIVTVSSINESKIIETLGGRFSVKLSLTEGKNIISVVAFDKETKQSQTLKREVLFLPTEILGL